MYRYEAMLTDGYTPRPDAKVVHEPDRFLWAPDLTRWQFQEIVRVSYFTTVVGTDEQVAELESTISQTRYIFIPHDRAGAISGFLCPRVFKKRKQGHSTKSVDINIAIDALRHAYSHTVDRIVILSGDGDYVPLIHEVMHQGVQVCVGAFSSGLNPQLHRVSDAFLDLDPHFLRPPIA